MIRIVIALLLVPFEAFCKIPEKIDCFQFVKHINEHARANWTVSVRNKYKIVALYCASVIVYFKTKNRPTRMASKKFSYEIWQGN